MNWVKGYIPLPGFIEAPNQIGGKKGREIVAGKRGREVVAGTKGGNYWREKFVGSNGGKKWRGVPAEKIGAKDWREKQGCIDHAGFCQGQDN